MIHFDYITGRANLHKGQVGVSAKCTHYAVSMNSSLAPRAPTAHATAAFIIFTTAKSWTPAANPLTANSAYALAHSAANWLIPQQSILEVHIPPGPLSVQTFSKNEFFP